MTIRTMTIDDYDGVYALWMTIKGFAIRSIDDSRVGVERFLKRNPTTSVVAIEDGKVYVLEANPRASRTVPLVSKVCNIQMVQLATQIITMNALKEEQISKVSLIAFTQNDIGNAFWNRIGWTQRLDLNYYDFVLNKENIEAFNE